MSTIAIISGMFILYTALFLMLNLYMTEKRQFNYRDKCILTSGGFTIMFLIGYLLNNPAVMMLSFPFLIHTLLLVLPIYKNIFKRFLGR